ncbi:Nucleoporin nup49/NSP49 (Nuclear pore protein nup49/NSP49) [Saitoella coloradoensis]
MFGQQSAQSPASTFTFGSTPAAPGPTRPTMAGAMGFNGTAQAGAGTNMFGAKPGMPTLSFGVTQSQQQPATAGGMFGSTQPQQTGFGTAQTQQPAAGGLGGGMFGQTQAQQPSFGGFGAGFLGQSQAQQPASNGLGGGLFGQAQNQQSGTGGLGGGMFGQTQTPTTGTQSMGFGGFGGQQQQQQQQMPQMQQQNASNITLNTRYSDLPPDAQKLLDEMDKFIATQTMLADDLSARLPTQNTSISTILNDVQEVNRKLRTTQSFLSTDQTSLRALREVVDNDSNNARVATRLVDGLRTGGIPRSAEPMIQYFAEQATEMEYRLQGYAGVIQEIGRHLETVEYTHERNKKGEVLLGALREQQSSFMNLSAGVADVHNEVRALESNRTGA